MAYTRAIATVLPSCRPLNFTWKGLRLPRLCQVPEDFFQFTPSTDEMIYKTPCFLRTYSTNRVFFIGEQHHAHVQMPAPAVGTVFLSGCIR